MKKPLCIWIPLLLLSSCGSKSPTEKIYLPILSENTITVDGNTDYLFETLTPDLLRSKIENKETFPLYVTAPGCGTCDIFSLTVKDYLRQKKAVLPHIQINAYLMVDSLPKVSDTSFLFIKEGEVIFTDSGITDTLDTTSDMIQYFGNHTKALSIPDLSAYQVTTPIRGDFNSYTLLNRVSGKDTVTAQFHLDSLRTSHARILFLNQEKRNLTEEVLDYLYANPDSLDGYCFVYEDIQEGVLKEATLVEERDFSSCIVTYTDTEKGYFLSETALEF